MADPIARTKWIDLGFMSMELDEDPEIQRVARRLDRINRNDDVYELSDIGGVWSRDLYIFHLARAMKPKDPKFFGELRRWIDEGDWIHGIAQQATFVSASIRENGSSPLKPSVAEWKYIGGHAMGRALFYELKTPGAGL